MEHEAAFVDAFISPERRDRYKQFLGNPKRRKEILDRLNQPTDLIQARCSQVLGSNSNPTDLERILRAKGATVLAGSLRMAFQSMAGRFH